MKRLLQLKTCTLVYNDILVVVVAVDNDYIDRMIFDSNHQLVLLSMVQDVYLQAFYIVQQDYCKLKMNYKNEQNEKKSYLSLSPRNAFFCTYCISSELAHISLANVIFRIS